MTVNNSQRGAGPTQELVSTQVCLGRLASGAFGEGAGKGIPVGVPHYGASKPPASAHTVLIRATVGGLDWLLQFCRVQIRAALLSCCGLPWCKGMLVPCTKLLPPPNLVRM